MGDNSFPRYFRPGARMLSSRWEMLCPMILRVSNIRYWYRLGEKKFGFLIWIFRIEIKTYLEPCNLSWSLRSTNLSQVKYYYEQARLKGLPARLQFFFFFFFHQDLSWIFFSWSSALHNLPVCHFSLRDITNGVDPKYYNAPFGSLNKPWRIIFRGRVRVWRRRVWASCTGRKIRRTKFERRSGCW